jgi:heme/copper-type cytochrome/quinol oxidase subunit 2
MSLFSSKMAGLSGTEGMEGMETAKAVGGMASIAFFIIMLIFAVIYFFPLLYLFRFSKHTKKAVANLDANEMKLGIKNMKSYWKYIGILIIILLSFYLLVLIFAGSSLALLSGLKG